ncbi:MAG: hypothetical protein KUG77_22000 [Nannocystaceae bacterium]|nr:hypothetical protein [Nannocystaceae bacterium]
MGPGDDEESDRAIGRLLSGRARLSRAEHESIAASVLEAITTEAAIPPKNRWWWPTGILVAAAAAGLLLVLLPDDTALRDPGPDPFSARGGAEGPQLRLVCEPDCRPGAHVVLEVADDDTYSHIAVFSFREDGAAIWYAPGDAAGTSVPLPAGARGLLPFRIELDEAHWAGRYDVVAVFSNAPLGRDALRSAYRERPDTVAVVERVLVVEASP